MKPATWLLPLLVFASLVSFNTWQRSKTSAAADADLANRIIADALQQGHSRALRQDPALVFGADAVAKAKATAASQPAAATTFDPTRTSSGSQLDLDAKEAFMRFQKQQLEVEASSATGANRSKVAELEAALERIIRDGWKKEESAAKQAEGQTGQQQQQQQQQQPSPAAQGAQPPMDYEQLAREARARADAVAAAAKQQAGLPVELRRPLTPVLYAAAVDKHCGGAAGNWCSWWHQQYNKSWPKEGPVHNKTCGGACNGVGTCNYELGFCQCPAGWAGEVCATQLKRPCARNFEPTGKFPASSVNATGHDVDIMLPGWMASRCAGVCDDDLAMCWCTGKHGRVRAPPGSPWGTPPVKMGRPLINCQPKTSAKGDALPWGHIPWESIFGSKGWCEADVPDLHCGCHTDGLAGGFCDKATEMYCPNQCSGRGACNYGYCRCEDGWFGADCSQPRHDLRSVNTTSKLEQELQRRPWLTDFVRLPMATRPERHQQARKRPFIYVYDLADEFTSRLLQYRVAKDACTWRVWQEGNNSQMVGRKNLYAIESHLHELMLQSEHRTLDPEEADFFYVPTYLACFIYPIQGWSDGPWYHAPFQPRVIHATNMLLEIRRWLRKAGPWWDRKQGSDHIMLMSHDEGACYAPTEMWHATYLVHWGRKDPQHVSQTAYGPDNYSAEFVHDIYEPKGWLWKIKGHPCYDPKKDLVIPSFKAPSYYAASPLAGRPAKKREVFLFFRGDVGNHREAHYSRGIRQRLRKMSIKHGWPDKFNASINEMNAFFVDYSEMMSKSLFCVVAPGDGWSSRMEESVANGCIPVIIMDDVDPVFGSILDVDSFAVRLPEERLKHIMEVLRSIPQAEVERKQRSLEKVWHRFIWNSHPWVQKEVSQLQEANAKRRSEDPTPAAQLPPGPRAETRDLQSNDAFHTIIQFLYGKLVQRMQNENPQMMSKDV